MFRFAKRHAQGHAALCLRSARLCERDDRIPLRGPDLHFCQLENDGLPSPSPQAFFSMFQKNCTGESTMPVRLLRKAMGCWTRPQGT